MRAATVPQTAACRRGARRDIVGGGRGQRSYRGDPRGLLHRGAACSAGRAALRIRTGAAIGGSGGRYAAMEWPVSTVRRPRAMIAGTRMSAVATHATSPIKDAVPKPRIARFSLMSSEP